MSPNNHIRRFLCMFHDNLYCIHFHMNSNNLKS